MGEFRMPSLGSDMEAGTLVEWRVAPGQAVRRGDVVAVVESDKGAIEVEVWESGVVEALLLTPPAKVPVGTPLARIRAEGEAAATPSGPAPAPGPEAAPPAAPAAAPRPAAPAPAPAGPVRASPAARALARERGVDLAAVAGTGPGGAVTREDVERAGTAAPAPPPIRPAPADAGERAAGLRRAIAAAMARSKREIPHYYLSTRIDLAPALAWLDARNRARPVTERLLSAVLLVKAVALSVADVPEMNGFFEAGAFRPGGGVHVGVAVSLRQGGLVAPALHDADRKDLDALMRDLADLITRARAGTLRASELSDPTITVTSLGDLGVDAVVGVIHPPQVALVGFGRVSDQPWVDGGRVVVRPVVTATLSADHRVSDGHRGGLFLAAVARRLATPEAL